MPRKHPPAVLAAIETLAQAEPNATARQIRDRLAAGDFPGLEPYSELGLRIVQYHAARARRELEPVPQDLDAASQALERRMFSLIRQDVRRLELKRELSVNDSRLLAQHQRTLRGMHANRLSRTDAARTRARADADAKPAGALERIGAVIAAGELEPVSPDSPH